MGKVPRVDVHMGKGLLSTLMNKLITGAIIPTLVHQIPSELHI